MTSHADDGPGTDANADTGTGTGDEVDSAIDPRLRRDTRALGVCGDTAVLLADDARWPWLILVPRRAGITELHDLTPDERLAFLTLVSTASALVQRECRCRSVNVAMLGNVVEQLHCHVVARSPGDPNWPGPIWGHGSREPYPSDALPAFATAIRTVLGANGPAAHAPR